LWTKNINDKRGIGSILRMVKADPGWNNCMWNSEIISSVEMNSERDWRIDLNELLALRGVL